MPHDKATASTSGDWPTAVERNFHMRIAADGSWFHEGGLIKRIELVKLFANVLQVDDAGQHWLRTPVEYGRIEVEDTPFVIVALDSTSVGPVRQISLSDNLHRQHKLSADTPLIFAQRSKQNTDFRPCLRLEGGLRARLSRPVWYELAKMVDDENASGMPGLWSFGTFFALQ